MTGILKVDQWKDSGDNTLMTSDGAGNLTQNTPISSNFLVGTTDADPAFNNVVGQSLAATGQIQVTRDGGTPLLVNRKTSHGDLVDFRKDGGTVGKITSAASGIEIYLGGTAAVNALDDYEEGSWTPTYNGASGGTNVGYYVKVGDIVTCYGHRWAFTSTAVSATISNFPFTSKSGVYISGTVGANTWTNNGASMWGYGSSGVFIYDCVNKQEATAIAGSPKYFSFSITYQTA